MLERDVERKLVDGVKKLGGRAYKWVSPGSNGVPDRIVILPGGKIIFIELKTTTGRLTDLQKMQHKWLTRLGCDVRTVYGAQQVQDLLDSLIAYTMEGFDDDEDYTT